MPKTLTAKIVDVESAIKARDTEYEMLSNEASEADDALEALSKAGVNGAAKPAIKLVKTNLDRARQRLSDIEREKMELAAKLAEFIDKRDMGKISEANVALLADICERIKAAGVAAPAGYFVAIDIDEAGSVVYKSITRKARKPRGAAARAAGQKFQWVESPDLAKVADWSLSNMKPATVVATVDLDAQHPTWNALVEAVTPGFTRRFKRGGEAAPRAGRDIVASLIKHAGGSYVEIGPIAEEPTNDDSTSDTTDTDTGHKSGKHAGKSAKVPATA